MENIVVIACENCSYSNTRLDYVSGLPVIDCKKEDNDCPLEDAPQEDK
jgi:hypothetical protein